MVPTSKERIFPSLNNVAPPTGAPVSSIDVFENLYPALVECFGIILLGYLAGRFGFISEGQAKGLSTFVGTFSLPALIFGSLSTLDLPAMNMTLLLSVFVSKAIVFFVVLGVTLLITRSSFGKAGLYAIFATQSNDFALGYPILKSLYQNTNPQIPMYLYLLAPVNLVVLNPVAFTLMEMEAQPSASDAATRNSKARTLMRILKAIVTNPIVYMSVLGMVSSTLVFHGRPLPPVMHNILSSLGSAFPATALFLLGLQMVGRMELLTGSFMSVPVLLVAAKTVMLPLIAMETTKLLNPGSNDTETGQLSDFAFLYGTFPTAPTVFVFASQYNIFPEMIASAMVLSTIVSAPVMFISSQLLMIPDINPSDYLDKLDSLVFDVSIVTVLASAWTIFIFVTSMKWMNVPHSQTFVLLIGQALLCAGAIMWSALECTQGWKLYVQYGLFAYGMYSSRINAALLSLLMALEETLLECTVRRIQPLLAVVGLVLPLVLVTVLASSVERETDPHGHKTDPFFQFGATQSTVSLAVLVLSFVTIIVCLIVTFRVKKASSPVVVEDEHRRLLPSASLEESVVDHEEAPARNCEGEGAASSNEEEISAAPCIEEIGMNRCDGRECRLRGAEKPSKRRYRCDSEHREYCGLLLGRYSAPPAADAVEVIQDMALFDTDKQTNRHAVLLVSLSITMFIGMALCIWMLTVDGASGLFLLLVFTDAIGSLGQGLVTFFVFGLESKYFFVPVLKAFRKLVYGQQMIVLPAWEELEEETKVCCRQFLRHHIDACMETIVNDVQVRLMTHRAAFRGRELVDWLLEMGLAADRQSGVKYGRRLLHGRVIRHIDNFIDFYDDDFVYTFQPCPTVVR